MPNWKVYVSTYKLYQSVNSTNPLQSLKKSCIRVCPHLDLCCEGIGVHACGISTGNRQEQWQVFRQKETHISIPTYTDRLMTKWPYHLYTGRPTLHAPLQLNMPNRKVYVSTYKLYQCNNSTNPLQSLEKSCIRVCPHLDLFCEGIGVHACGISTGNRQEQWQVFRQKETHIAIPTYTDRI